MRFKSSRGIVLKSSRSTRWPYLFLSTVFGRVELDVLGRTIWNSPGIGVFLGEGDDTTTFAGVPLLAEVVFVDVRERGAVCCTGEGVRGLVLIAAFQGATTGVIFWVRKISGNLVNLKVDFIDSNSCSSGIPSITDTRPVRFPSFRIFSMIGKYPLSEHPTNTWWQWQLYRYRFNISKESSVY